MFLRKLRYLLPALACLFVVPQSLLKIQAEDSEQVIDFANQIRPILANHCWTCHGPDEKSRAADLRLDNREDAIESSAIIPNAPGRSGLIHRILSEDPESQMPPPSSKKPLSEKQKKLLHAWIEQGANYSKHWSFTSPVRPHVPQLQEPKWASNAIDQFVGSRLEREQVKPSDRADRSTLLRRVSLDLTGLPPTVEELQKFLDDPASDAYERVVDRLLSSSAYAEKMAMEWLDLARYADTNGYNNDEDRTMWPWRDWVIHAFDRNMPFDQFAIEQLAGDLLPDHKQDQLIATGFLRNQGHNTEGGIIQEEYRVEYVADRVHTVSTVFLGLSMQCARCHDHKFDPITQKEYYQFYSFFNSLDEKQAPHGKVIGVEPYIRVPTMEQQSKMESLSAEIALIESQKNQLEMDAETNIAKLLEETNPNDLRARFDQSALYHFPLDRTEGSSLFESISNSSSGTTSGTIRWQAGKKQDAIELDATSRIEIENTANFASDQSFSISVWVKPASLDGMAILSKMDEAQNYRGYDLLLSGGKVEMHLVHKWPENAIKISSSTSLTPNEWHHIVVTYNGSKTAAGINLFVDSKPTPIAISRDSLRDSIETPQPFRLGLREKSLPFKGLLDELHLFGNVLEESSVKQLASFLPVSGFADWIKVPSEQRTEEQRKQIHSFYLARMDPSYPALQNRLAVANKEKLAVQESAPSVMVMREMNPRRETFVLKRGQYDQPADLVEPTVPASLKLSDMPTPQNRLELAKWIVDERNPLTARVTVNRWWQSFFGTGIVQTAEDFGLTGEAPSHPELLDFLARALIESGWNVKATLKMIVMSSTYQQESRIQPSMLERDPENRLLARGPRHRLPAETIRDNALAISGLLKHRLGGPSVKPYQPEGLWEDVTVNRQGKYVADIGEGLYRRSLYTFWKRTCPPPSMMSFDAPMREVCTARRARTNTPLQSLVLLNDPTYVECARKLAEYMLHQGTSVSERLDAGFQRSASRRATQEEHAILSQVLETTKLQFAATPARALSLNAIGATQSDANIDSVELASWTILASTLLNLDETISKR